MADHIPTPVPAVLTLKHWGGISQQAVLIVGGTPRRFRIRALVRTKLAGRDRWLDAGEETLVPRTSIHVLQQTLRDFGDHPWGFPSVPGMREAAKRAADEWENRNA